MSSDSWFDDNVRMTVKMDDHLEGEYEDRTALYEDLVDGDYGD